MTFKQLTLIAEDDFMKGMDAFETQQVQLLVSFPFFADIGRKMEDQIDQIAASVGIEGDGAEMHYQAGIPLTNFNIESDELADTVRFMYFTGTTEKMSELEEKIYATWPDGGVLCEISTMDAADDDDDL